MRPVSWGMPYLLMVPLQKDKTAKLKEKKRNIKFDNVVRNYEVKRFLEGSKYYLRMLKKMAIFKCY